MTVRVLVVDDHAVMRQGLDALLKATPDIAVVGEARTGREALARAAELEPDVVIMDISMPELNGLEATRLLREKHPSLQVVILSMHADAEYLFRAFEAGAAGYLLKESAVAEIVKAIRAVRAGRRYVGAGVAADAGAGGAEAVLRSPLQSLSARERQILQLVVEGHSSAEIAALVHLSRKTVETYRSRLMRKVGVSDLPGLIKFAIHHGVTPPR